MTDTYLDPFSLSSRPGTYILILSMAANQSVAIGRLGPIAFQRGYYAYVGSVFGPGGLAARIGRHLNPTPKIHWHIDYLKPHGVIRKVWVSRQPVCLEHSWAQALLSRPAHCRAIAGFGCSDCTCPSHLFYFTQRPTKKVLPHKTMVEVIQLGSLQNPV